MPFKSEKQRKWMHANEPKMAKDWEKKNEGPQKDRNELALYMIELNKMLANAKILQKRKDPKAKIYIKMIQQDLKDAKKKMAKLKSVNENSAEKAKIVKLLIKYGNNPKEVKPWVNKHYKKAKGDRSGATPAQLAQYISFLTANESVNEAERDYKAEYKKYGSSTKAKKYRAELNQYNRKKGTYGNGDGKDASHKGGKIVGFEKESVNRGRAEKSRLKKEANMPDFNPMIDKALDEVIEEYTMSRKGVIDKIATLAKANKYGNVDGTQMNGKTAKQIIAIYNHPKMKRFKKAMGDYTVDQFVDLTIKLPKVLGIKENNMNEGQKKRASDILRKFDMAYIKFSQEVRDVMKLMDKSTGNKTDSRIINKAYGKHLIPFDDIMQSWARGQQNNPKIDESVKEGTTQKFNSAKIDRAIKIAKSMGGNMTAAVKKIEKIEKNLSKNGRVEYALQQANESINEAREMSIKDAFKDLVKDHGARKALDMIANVLSGGAFMSMDDRQVKAFKKKLLKKLMTESTLESINELQRMRPAVKKLLKQKGYSPIFQAIDNSKRQFKQMRYSRGEIQDTLIDMFGDEDPKILQKIKESVNEGISVADERSVGKFTIVILTDGGKMRSAVLSKKNANKYNRNDKDVLKNLWNLADKYKGQEIKESVNEAPMELNKIKDAILMFQKKIKKQGRVTNARDEEHLERLMKVYNDMGGRKIKENNELFEWLYEACWKGYEKKGMKKMFGKMYPNCVKKTKKEGIGDKFAKKVGKHKAVRLKSKSGMGKISHLGIPQPSKGVEKLLKIADSGYGKVGGTTVDGMSANLFKQVYNKANDDIKKKLNTKNEKQLVRILGGMWKKFGKNVTIGSSV